MNLCVKTFRQLSCPLLLLAALFFLHGCTGADPANLVLPAGKTGSSVNGTNYSSSTLKVGDQLTITFSGVISPIPDQKLRIKEDGTINLPLIDDPVVAAGKKVGELEKEVHDLYVPNIYQRLNVTIRPQLQTFTVDGEVRSPQRLEYVGPITVLRAIAAAGGFTDFANPRNVELIRANGDKGHVNAYKAIDNPKLDLEVFPGDYIKVHKKWW